METYRWSLWLLLWIQNPRVHSPVVRAADCRSAGPWFNSGVEVMVYLHDRIRQSDELSRTDVQQYEPNQNSNHNDHKKFS